MYGYLFWAGVLSDSRAALEPPEPLGTASLFVHMAPILPDGLGLFYGGGAASLRAGPAVSVGYLGFR